MADHTVIESAAKLKQCSACKAEKPTTEFWKDRRQPDSLNRECKGCRKAYFIAHFDAIAETQRKNFQRNKGKIAVRRKMHESKAEVKHRIREKNQVWYENNIEQHRTSGRKWLESPAGRQSKRLSSKLHREKYPEKAKARYSLANAVKAGKIIRPTNCESCGDTGKIEGHHHKGYDEANWFNVKWLCVSCHRRIELGLPPRKMYVRSSGDNRDRDRGSREIQEQADDGTPVEGVQPGDGDQREDDA